MTEILARSSDREELPREFTIRTSQGEVITYRRGNEGYWHATQEGMPDHWMLSRVASRAVEELARVESENERLKETALTDEECEAVIRVHDTPFGSMAMAPDAFHAAVSKLRRRISSTSEETS